MAGLGVYILCQWLRLLSLFSTSISTPLPNYVIIYSTYTLVLILRNGSCI